MKTESMGRFERVNEDVGKVKDEEEEMSRRRGFEKSTRGERGRFEGPQVRNYLKGNLSITLWSTCLMLGRLSL